ncbi:uncharacterized protein JCM10292_005499 [Rhodotorula paludigena]|uniref:uncharacterized protein n=1 Tax=Rhodotorula paludigena TaxID=86838 RepID=UPI00317B1E7A
MLVQTALSALLPALALAAAPAPQLYLSPAPPRLSASSPPLALSAAQANAVLAHHLGVAHHVQLPLASGKSGREWEKALEDASEHVALEVPARIVVVLECGKAGCDDAIPADLASNPSLSLPSLPATSYLAAFSLHLHRLADSLGLDADSPAVRGLKELVSEGIKSVVGWQAWVGDELGSWIGWHDEPRKVKAAVEPEAISSGLFTDLDMLDSSASQLILELERLTSVADSMASTSSSASADSGPQGQDEAPKVVVMHLKGLKEIAAKHSRQSQTYQTASSLVKQTLTGLIASVNAHLATAEQARAKVVLLALPPHPTPLLRKRTPWLAPFESSQLAQRFGSSPRARALNAHVKRSVFSPRQEETSTAAAAAANGSSVIVPSGYTCFASEREANDKTARCLGRGEPVRGITTRVEGAQGGECWVCKCGETVDDETGRRTRWKGQGCEKEDLSAPFTLLASTTLLLTVLVGGGIALLYAVGEDTLPGTLSAVSGMGGHAKRD